MKQLAVLVALTGSVLFDLERDEVPPTARTIDGTRFVAEGHQVRPFTKQVRIEVPVHEVFAAWTDADVFPRAYAPDSSELAANIDLAIGGRFEWLWDGTTGSNGCQILSYLPDRMLSFSWNAPPSQPESRAHHTWVVVEFDAVSDGATELALTHLGFGPEPHWDETRAYFQKAWDHVLAQFRTNLEARAAARD